MRSWRASRTQPSREAFQLAINLNSHSNWICQEEVTKAHNNVLSRLGMPRMLLQELLNSMQSRRPRLQRRNKETQLVLKSRETSDLDEDRLMSYRVYHVHLSLNFTIPRSSLLTSKPYPAEGEEETLFDKAAWALPRKGSNKSTQTCRSQPASN
jgi:hypothetical protein